MTANKDSKSAKKEESVFGNKITYWGTVFFIFLILLAVYRHLSMDVPFGGEGEEVEMIDTQKAGEE